MLTRLRLRNFKQFDDVDIELGKSVVFIGPNNSGKTSALQALALWDVGLRLWNAKRGGKASPKKRPGVMINRRDLITIPIPAANLLWRGTHTRDSQKVDGKQQTRNIRIDVTVEGITNDRAWTCGLEFDYSNAESFGCRPLRSPGFENTPVGKAEFSEIPDEATALRIAYLPPMSGFIDEVTRLLAIDEKFPWSPDVKATDEVLDRVFRVFFKKMELPVTFRKSDYHVLAKLVPNDNIDSEVTDKLDAIVQVAERATARRE